MRSNQMTELFLFQRCMEADACSTEIIVWKNPEADVQFQICLESFLYRNQNLFTSLCLLTKQEVQKRNNITFLYEWYCSSFFTTLITIVKFHSSMPTRLNE